jgi:endonuclease/exonuclease/phosphatase family metal-dependent hydrolase
MKIYSWNMLYRNHELDRAFEFISHADFDIFCLQEVPEDFLARLRTLSFYIASGRDTEKIFASGSTVSMYTVILSKYPITAHSEILFNKNGRLPSLRVRLFTLLMRPFHFSFVRNRGGLYADVTMNGATVRIFTLHLALTHPTQRLEEFERAMLDRDPTKPTIVCGDFNILEKPHITPLNWFMGGKVSDSLLFTRERTHIEKRFVEHELTNVLRGNITHNLSRSQLDHILVSHSFSIENSAVLPDCVGSDHHPIRAEIS